ncbi:MAG: prolipoprotein diacylglyceryl transferase [Nitrospinota bacterium]
MYPVLIKIGPFTLYTYGLLVATGMLVAIAYSYYRSKKEGMDGEVVLDLCFWVVVGAIAGSRVLYIVVNYRDFLGSPLDIFKIWKGGLVFYGGFIGAVVFGIWYTSKHKMPVWKTADLLAPGVALGHSIGRWGCLASGSCFGRPTESWMGITFLNPLAIAPLGVKLFPTQIFDSINELTIFFILITVRPYKKFDGQIVLMWAMLYAAGRFVIEFYRGDPQRGYIIPGTLSTSQGIAAAVFIVSLFLLLRFLRKAK